MEEVSYLSLSDKYVFPHFARKRFTPTQDATLVPVAELHKSLFRARSPNSALNLAHDGYLVADDQGYLRASPIRDLWTDPMYHGIGGC